MIHMTLAMINATGKNVMYVMIGTDNSRVSSNVIGTSVVVFGALMNTAYRSYSRGLLRKNSVIPSLFEGAPLIRLR